MCSRLLVVFLPARVRLAFARNRVLRRGTRLRGTRQVHPQLPHRRRVLFRLGVSLRELVGDLKLGSGLVDLHLAKARVGEVR